MRMCSKTVYIGGNMGAFDGKKVTRRFKKAEKALKKAGYKVLTPLRGKSVTCLDEVNAGKYLFTPNEIVHRDLNDIRQANIMIAMEQEPSIGTAMEICYARAVMDIPVIVVTTNPKVKRHYWIQVFASKIVDSVEEAVKHITKWEWYV